MRKIKKLHLYAYISLVLFVILMFAVAWYHIPVLSGIIPRGIKEIFTGGAFDGSRSKLITGLLFYIGSAAVIAFLILFIVRAVKKNKKQYLGIGITFIVVSYIIIAGLFFLYYGTLGVEINGHYNIVHYYVKVGLKALTSSTASIGNHVLGLCTIGIGVTMLLFIVLEIVAYFKTLKLVEADEATVLEEEQEDIMTEEEMREIIREELLAFHNQQQVEETPTVEEPVVVEEPVIVEETVVEEVVETPVVEPVKEAQPLEGTPVDTNANGRISFLERFPYIDKELIDIYDEIKNEIMSYGVKSRVSSSGDTFRLHRVTYMKMIVAGKKIKLYMRLDPKAFKDSTIPFDDVSHKKIYEEIPFVFKVKSGLSIRRAKDLIKQMMEENGIARVSEPANVKYGVQLIEDINAGRI